ncbi:hypothetical protein FB45DRAFT_1059408 [Roridomyces roridus]|uniref:Uncharacterized protein n=1 Tax=Roridomyces roridus TaxID=1738132 RepID=A0AAD7BSG5_9AGAR|nr:hypothetical protein FB45DRAFT_1059408 [Roridomyces roridus]
MGRWTQYDEDEYRLPEGMVRTGYDADTGQYYFSDRRSGTTYVGAPGEEFGTVYAVGAPEATNGKYIWASGLSVAHSYHSAPEDRSKSTKRRATFAYMQNPFQSLKRSLTTARTRWRREQSPIASSESEEEESVLASRPSSAGLDDSDSSFRTSESSFISDSRPLTPPADSTTKLPSRRSASTSSSAHTPRSPGDSRRAASEHIHPTTTSGRFLPIEKHVTSPMATAASPVSKSVDADSTTKSSSPTKPVSSSVDHDHAPKPRGAASEHSGSGSLERTSSRVPRVEESNIEKYTASPVATGTATRSQNVRRSASDQGSALPRTSAGVPGS